MPDLRFAPPSPARQLGFHQLLIAARKKILEGALLEVLGQVDPDTIKDDLSRLAPTDARQALSKSGIRDEMVFMTPTVLRASPTLFGYYRLLLGVSKKIFYTAETGFARFARMEEQDVLTEWHDENLEEACSAMNKVLGELVMQISPDITAQDVTELPLLTLGSQFQGSNNNTLGQAATQEVFLAIKDVLEGRIIKSDERSVTIADRSGQEVRLVLSADPDVSVEKTTPEGIELIAAIEIKGGTDKSNAHNRAGEAEKSHQKVKGRAANIWTLITMKGLSLDQLKRESPTTEEWFDISHILARKGEDWTRFTAHLSRIVDL
jgi:hypothetical protein